MARAKVRNTYQSVINEAKSQIIAALNRSGAINRAGSVGRETATAPQYSTSAGTDENGNIFTKHIAFTNLDSTNKPGSMTG